MQAATQPAVSANPITDHIQRRIDYYVAHLVRRCRFPASDWDDLRQEFVLDLLQALPRYDPSRAGQNTFVDRVLRRRMCLKLRRAGIARRHAQPMRERRQPPDSQSELRLLELRLDVQTVLAQLSPREQQVAALLHTRTPAQIARQLGLSAPGVQAIRRRLQHRFTSAGITNRS